MDFEDTPEEARYRDQVRTWLEAHKEISARVPRGEYGAYLDAGATAQQVQMSRGWQRLLYDAGFIGINWLKEYGGQGGTIMQQVIFSQELDRLGAPPPLNRIGLGMAGPTIIAHGTEEHKKRYLAPLLRADEIWCQLFSEPAAGSDLASLETKAVRDGDDFIVNGQKVWTSGGHYADLAILVARTDPNLPKHNGLTYFILDMHSPGVTARPLRQMSGGASFNEVFLDNVRIPAANIIGKEGQGWTVSMTTLTHERMVGTVVGDAERFMPHLIKLVRQTSVRGRPALTDSGIRQLFARVITEGLAVRYSGYRRLSALSKGQEPGPESSTAKFMSTDFRRHTTELAVMIQGLAGAVCEGSEYAVVGGHWQDILLELPGATLAGGSDEILKNVTGERVLGLPGEPRIDKGIAFKDLPRGTMQ